MSCARVLKFIALLAVGTGSAELRANTTYNLGGIPASVQLEVVELQKDAELIGMSKSRFVETATARLRRNKIAVDGGAKAPTMVVKITTIDAGPRVVSYVSLELKELARLSRLSFRDHPRFVTSWGRAKMIVSEPTKHEEMALKAMLGLVDDFVREAHE